MGGGVSPTQHLGNQAAGLAISPEGWAASGTSCLPSQMLRIDPAKDEGNSMWRSVTKHLETVCVCVCVCVLETESSEHCPQAILQ